MGTVLEATNLYLLARKQWTCFCLPSSLPVSHPLLGVSTKEGTGQRLPKLLHFSSPMPKEPFMVILKSGEPGICPIELCSEINRRKLKESESGFDSTSRLSQGRRRHFCSSCCPCGAYETLKWLNLNHFPISSSELNPTEEKSNVHPDPTNEISIEFFLKNEILSCVLDGMNQNTSSLKSSKGMVCKVETCVPTGFSGYDHNA